MNTLAVANANKLINKYLFKDPKELNENFEAVIYEEGLILKEEELKNCEGRILFDDERGLITINSNIEDKRQKKFTIAHEMGHFFNEKGNGSYKCGFEEIFGNNKSYVREANANDFAAELLMHNEWFSEFTSTKKISVKLFEGISEYFDVSLSAAVLRYSIVGYYPIAVIMSTNKIIKWTSINKNFRFQFIRIGKNVSDLSYAFDFFEGKEIPLYEDVPVVAWFSEDFKLKNREERIYEMNIPMRRYNSILTILWEK